jgi:AraC-like DNA-binding protein
VLGWLHATQRVPPTVAALARELGISRTYVHKLINEQTAVTAPVTEQPAGDMSERDQVSKLCSIRQ